jgi:beta-glucosidase
MVDIARDARWGRIVEGAGEDPYLGSALAAAYVRGYQGTNLADPSSMAACAKHYVGYGAAEAGRDYNTTEIPVRLLRQVYLPPFHAAVNAGAATLMSAFNAINEIPASANAFTLTDVLRKEWGFRGFVVSDWGAIGELINHSIALDGATAARKGLTAGVDMDMESNLYLTQLPKLVQSGVVPQVVDEAVRRILRVKFALGLFDHPYANENAAAAAQLTPANSELARTVAEKSFVLLKNDPAAGGAPLLPIPSNVKTIALIGPLADSAPDMLGSWGAKGDPKDAVTLRAALEKRSGIRVVTEKGTDINGTSDSGFGGAVNAARQADLAILCLGENAGEMTGEAASRVHLGLPGNQEQLLEQVAGAGKPVVLIVFSGRPLQLNWAAAHVPAIMEAWFPGVQAGPALVRTLFGEVAPSGKTTVSFPRAVGQEPLYYNQLPTGRPLGNIPDNRPPTNGEEKYHSRYIDSPNSPLFPFGWGLTYTTFSYGPTQVSANQVSATALNGGGASALRVSAEVRNTGQRPGEEIVQLYIRLRGTSVERPVRELKGFQKITLSPGESRRVEFTLGRDELSFWNIDMRDVVEPAALTVWVAPNSISGTPAEVTISQQ